MVVLSAHTALKGDRTARPGTVRGSLPGWGSKQLRWHRCAARRCVDSFPGAPASYGQIVGRSSFGYCCGS